MNAINFWKREETGSAKINSKYMKESIVSSSAIFRQPANCSWRSYQPSTVPKS